MNAQALTHRQTQVYDLICRGLTNKQIGQEMKLSEKTVKAHVTGLFDVLGVSNRVQAVLLRAPTLKPADPQPSSQEQFEAWAIKFYDEVPPQDVVRKNGESYFYGPVNGYWACWQAARGEL